MNTNTTKTVGAEARGQSEQGFRAPAGFCKYIIILWQGREQVVSLPFTVKHADVLAYIRRQECGDVQAISAGFYYCGQDVFWHGGESTTLNLKSRPEDRQLLQSFFSSADRAAWDLTGLTTREGGAQ
jgi:hypothetical protein